MFYTNSFLFFFFYSWTKPPKGGSRDQVFLQAFIKRTLSSSCHCSFAFLYCKIMLLYIARFVFIVKFLREWVFTCILCALLTSCV